MTNPSTPPSAQAPLWQSLSDGLQRGDFAALPPDWCIAVADVQGSTAAIAQGRYKQVNAVGAACIVAACNMLGRDDLAFIFGGDGATVALPSAWWPKLQQAWQALALRAKREFDLTLRVGAVPVAELQAQGAQVQLAWQALPAGFRLACFVGDGLQRAEDMVKQQSRDQRQALAQPASTRTPHESAVNHAAPAIPAAASANVDISVDGLECRWNDIPAKNGQVVCVLARPTGQDVSGVVELMQTIENWGPSVWPVQADKVPVSAQAQHLDTELALRVPKRLQRAWSRGLVQLKLKLLAPIMRRDILNPSTVAGRYALSVGMNCDHLKFDGVLRTVLDLSPEQDHALQKQLERLRQQGKIAFGVHRSTHALMTCFVRSLENHVHFVDGGDGGYARAATQLKASQAGGSETNV